MIQRFIELGEGYSDIYELIELARTNSERIHRLLLLKTMKNDREVVSPVVVLKPAGEGNLQPLYICREGIPAKEPSVQRLKLFEEVSATLSLPIIPIEVKPSSDFNENDLYYNYIIGILRLNNLIPPLQ
ncbi:MAG: methylthioribose kinase [Anaerobacillus sp.]